MSFAVFTPLHYERNYAYPLVVWLHGPDDSEQQLARIMPLVSLRNYVAMAPRGTAAGASNPTAFCWQQSEEHIAAAEGRVLECLAISRQRFNVSLGRVFLAGHGCGGTMALRLALRNPDYFAGVLSFGGRFPKGHAPLVRLNAARRLAIFLSCSRASRRYTTEMFCDDLRLIHAAGVPAITVCQYPGDDGLRPRMLTDMDRWLMEQITGGGGVLAAAVSSQGEPN
ncbi:MAG TPA: alpha/beta hydrolase-fold protein [Pirellulales bacterium]|nr:alpha/beta hydrolase-fold protein [Pirellulales bacterium]